MMLAFSFAVNFFRIELPRFYLLLSVLVMAFEVLLFCKVMTACRSSRTEAMRGVRAWVLVKMFDPTLFVMLPIELLTLCFDFNKMQALHAA